MANLISNEWKHTLETNPSNSVNSLVSLYDLFYDENGKLWVESDDPTAGCKLDHDIICFNRSILSGSSNDIDTHSTPDMETSVWWTYGIDISIPLFDSRSKHKEVLCNASIGKGSPISIFNGGKFRIYDKDAALAPNSIDVFTVRGVLSSGAITKATWQNYVPPSIGTFHASGDPKNEDTDIILSCPDTVFKSTLVTQDGMEAYNRIMVNPYSWYGISLIIKATGMNFKDLIGNDKFSSGRTSSTFDTTVNSFENFWSRIDQDGNFVAHAIDLGGNSWDNSSAVTAGTIDETRWFTLLKNTFVWIRAPFYGDYIIPDNFEQDLDPNAKVVHNELMLSGAGDFKKYDIYATDTSVISTKKQAFSEIPDNFTNLGIGMQPDDSKLAKLNPSESSMPYIPKTSPTVDIYTSLLLDGNKDLKGIKAKEDLTNFSAKLGSKPDSKIDDFLDNQVSGNNMVVRGLPISAINRNDASDEVVGSKPDDLVPPNYFEPESRKTGSDYRQMGKFPTIIPNDGNLYVDGRIIGPSMDEIWIMLKKLTGGRLSDYIEDETGSTPANQVRARSTDLGIPYGSTERTSNNTDTTMTEVPDSQFNFKYENSESLNKVGDPIDFVYTPDNSILSSGLFNQKLKVTKFINQNDAIVYPVYKSLKDLSSDVTTFDTTENNERGITNFTAWMSIGKSSKTVQVDGEDVVMSNDVGDNATIISGVWGPREAPYSLRELEAMIMGNKYNIITQARFLKENFAVTGKLGKVNGYDEEDMYNFTSGSIYQMHRNYNFDVTNPNTYYNVTGTEDGYRDGKTCGAKAIIDDDDIRTEQQVKEGHIRYAETYGTSKALNCNAEKYSSSDVYLSAFGDWRYVSDHNRVPCLRAEF